MASTSSAISSLNHLARAALPLCYGFNGRASFGDIRSDEARKKTMRICRIVSSLTFAVALVGMGCAEDSASAPSAATPAAAAAPAAGGAAQAKPAGVVVSVTGDVMAKRAVDGAVERKLAVDGQIFGDDTIATGPEGAVSIRLNHNRAVWTLAAKKRKRVDKSAAWRAPKGSKTQMLARRVKGELTSSAGRHSEQEAAGSAETASRKAAEVDKKMVERVAAAEKARAPVAKPAPRRVAAAPAPRRAARRAAPAPAAPPPSVAAAPIRDNVAAAAPARMGAPPAAAPSNKRAKAAPAAPAYDTPVASAPAKMPIGLPPVAPAAEAAPLAVVRLKLELVKGALDKAVASKALRRRIPAVRSCYESALDKNPKLAGKIKVILVIGADGSVERAVVDDSGMGGGKIGKCIRSKLAGLRFPALPADLGDKKRFIKAAMNFSTK